MADEKKALDAGRPIELQLPPNETMVVPFDPPVDSFQVTLQNLALSPDPAPAIVEIKPDKCDKVTVEIPQQQTVEQKVDCPNTTEVVFTNLSPVTINIGISAG